MQGGRVVDGNFEDFKETFVVSLPRERIPVKTGYSALVQGGGPVGVVGNVGVKKLAAPRKLCMIF